MTKVWYDNDNIFAKIIRNEISCKKIDECDHTLSFSDIRPVAKIHVLVLPKKSYTDIDDFIENSSDIEKISIFNAINRVTKKTKIKDEGYRVITNKGFNGNQEVPHLHFHIIGGEKLGNHGFNKN